MVCMGVLACAASSRLRLKSFSRSEKASADLESGVTAV